MKGEIKVKIYIAQVETKKNIITSAWSTRDKAIIACYELIAECIQDARKEKNEELAMQIYNFGTLLGEEFQKGNEGLEGVRVFSLEIN